MTVDREAATSSSVEPLVYATIARFVSPIAAIDRIDEVPIRAGLSGDAIVRIRVGYTTPAGKPEVTPLVLKNASSTERRVLAWLQAMPNRHVPYTMTLDPGSTEPALICMEDLGEAFRPNSLAPIQPGLQQREAEALADIHAASAGAAVLDGLPVADRDYVESMLERTFRPAWERATSWPEFRERFGPSIEPVERRAATIGAGMAEVFATTSPTLVHTDINPSNVLVRDGRPAFIDWGSAHAGSFYLDLPHHFATIEQAGIYRTALAGRGLSIDPARFAHSYAIAARYTGLRYLWWTLDAWRDDPADEPWVRHYLTMIVR